MPDIPTIRPAPLVVKLGGAALEDQMDCSALWTALSALHRAEPGGLVVVHGGGSIVDQRLARLGLTSERQEGIRITTPEQVAEVVATLAGLVNTRVVGLLQGAGAPAVGLTLTDGFLAAVARSTRFAFDPGCVGEVIGGRADLAETLLGAGFMPAIASVGVGPGGQLLNINADEAAAGIAAVLNARALILLTDVDGVRDASGSLLERLSTHDVDGLIASGAIYNGMIPKVRGAVEAATVSGAPTAIASWHDAANVAALARGEGTGT
ncbi:MAG: acetylglutamate kinase [Phycisphaerales bacterium]|nr:acetylglutamate kinase [Phycisphaerales bacterium]